MTFGEMHESLADSFLLNLSDDAKALRLQAVQESSDDVMKRTLVGGAYDTDKWKANPSRQLSS